MSLSVDPTLRGLNDCGCCEGVSGETPAGVENRPGLSAILYRVGTHAQFKETMLARLSGSGQAALRNLRTREDDDFSIALLDAWAIVADVLTFYQERIANESYLRTATERRSVLELARLIGYELRPGVAASTYLAFTLEDAPGAFGQALNLGIAAQVVLAPPPPITVDAGAKVQSVPGPGEVAQTFETIERIEARTEWNALKPRLSQPQELKDDMGSVVLAGEANNLKKGDTLLIVETGGARETRTIQNVTVDADAKTTRVDFDSPALSPATFTRPASLPAGNVTDFPSKTELTEAVVKQIIEKKWSEENLSALVRVQNWNGAALVANIAEQSSRRGTASGAGVFVFRQRAAVFGHNAPNYDLLTASLNASQRNSVSTFAVAKLAIEHQADSIADDIKASISLSGSLLPPNWENRTLEDDAQAVGNLRTVDLDAAYAGITKDGWLAISAPGAKGGVLVQTFKVKEHAEIARSDYAISGKVSRLRVETSSSFSNDFKIRNTSALATSEQLALADVPVEDVVTGDAITLNRTYLGLKTGQRIILTGERDDLRGETVSETRTLREVLIEAGFTLLILDKPLTYSYVRRTVQINANVAPATHGETVREVLGGGDAARAFQSFTLRQPPLTYTSAANASGSASTLEVRVNDLLWHEVSTFFGRGSDERIYVTRTDDDGKTTVTFGDGKTGARLPTGQENVAAKYRKGTGRGGLVKAQQLSQLMTRPLGVKGVTNPLAPAGAADAEDLSGARRNAPLTVLTLGRVVSLQDYEDFARSFSGIEKARAVWVWSGERRQVVLTVAGAEGVEVSPDSALYKNLLDALRQFGDARVPLTIASYEPRFFRLAAAVQTGADFLPEKVLAEVETKLRESFSFGAREFGQPASLSEVVGVMHAVAGVEAIDVNEFYGAEESTPSVKPRLEAKQARPGGGQIFPAQILTLDSRPLALEVMP